MRPIAVLAAVALMSTATASVPLGDAAPPATFAVQASDPAGLPGGWRWESFGGVEVGVPGEWGWADSNLRLATWCVSPDKEPVVGRPSRGALLVACSTPPGEADPAALIRNTGWVVAFGYLPAPDGVERRLDRTTVRLAGVEVTVQVPKGLRERIAATVHRVSVDSAGCPVTDPVSTRPLMRPAPAADVTALHGVTAVSACKYQLHSAADPGPARLTSSLRLDGAVAAEAVRQIGRAPRGGGPDNPRLCSAADHGDESIVLRVQSAAGPTKIMLRYSGCTHSGFDDGVTLRRLTAAAVAPFVAGPNQVFSFPGPDEKIPMLMPGPR